MRNSYYTLALVVAIILLAFFFLGNAHAQEVNVGEITVTSSTIANILPVSVEADLLTSLPGEGEAWRADRIAVLVDAESVGQEPLFQPDSTFLAELDSLLNAAQAKIIEQQGTIEGQAVEIASKDTQIAEQDALIASQDAEITTLRESVAPLEQQVAEQDVLIAEQDALIAQYEEGFEIARQSMGQFQQWLRDFDSQ